MGYPNPHESEYDLFMTGHAGCSVSTALGLASGDDLLRPDEDRWTRGGDRRRRVSLRHRVRGAEQRRPARARRLLVILNDNKMSICPRVGGVADYLDRLRMNPLLHGPEGRGRQACSTRCRCWAIRSSGSWRSSKKRVKAGLHGGMMFEDLGFRYIGPIDGHNIGLLRKYLKMVKDARRARCCCTSSPRKATASSPPRKTRCSSTRRRSSSGATDQVVQHEEERRPRAYTHVAAQAISRRR